MNESFGSIEREHRPRVEAFCRHVLSEGQDAENATEETFRRVEEALPRFSGEQSLEEWITRIAAEVCADYLRSRRRQSETD